MQIEAERLDWILGFAERWGTKPDGIPHSEISAAQAESLMLKFEMQYSRAQDFQDLSYSDVELYIASLEADCGV